MSFTRKIILAVLTTAFTATSAYAAPIPAPASLQDRLRARMDQTPEYKKSSVIFDLPLSYNKRVAYWIAYYQSKGKTWFSQWLTKASRYLPYVQAELQRDGLPQDLAFIVMIESGFEPNAKSSANAVGPWQFIESTGKRYGLKVTDWLDERRDLKKSTLAAIHYLRDLHNEFGSWYLVAASYNMGETGLRRQIKRYGTVDYWALTRLGALPTETTDYVPKVLAAMMIAKSPGLYGFDNVTKLAPLEYEVVSVPGGTRLSDLADHMGVTHKCLNDLNAELVQGVVPHDIEHHAIRVPKGAVAEVAEFVDAPKNL